MKGNPKITDAILNRLSGSQRLRYLDLSGSSITDAVLDALSKFVSLKGTWLTERERLRPESLHSGPNGPTSMSATDGPANGARTPTPCTIERPGRTARGGLDQSFDAYTLATASAMAFQ